MIKINFLDIKNNQIFILITVTELQVMKKWIQKWFVVTGVILAAFQKKHIWHSISPRKSQSNGLKLLSNFFKK